MLFDAMSGDFWVLTDLARTLLQAMEANGPLPSSEWQAHLEVSAKVSNGLIAGLTRAGLVMASNNGIAVALAQSTDHAF